MEFSSFETSDDLGRWLGENHARAQELWVRVFHKDAAVPSVDWQDCVVAAIAWGWIDGQKKPFDDHSYLQRLSPRKPKSNWSEKNKRHAERLIAEGRMSGAGLRQVEAAKADGRWDRTYAGQADMEIPRDFLDALEGHPAAKAFFATLDRKNLFAIYYRLTTARRPQTRADRMRKILDQLNREERFH